MDLFLLEKVYFFILGCFYSLFYQFHLIYQFLQFLLFLHLVHLRFYLKLLLIQSFKLQLSDLNLAL